METVDFNIDKDQLINKMVEENLDLRARVMAIHGVFQRFFISKGWTEQQFNSTFEELYNESLFEIIGISSYLPDDAKIKMRKEVPGLFNLRVVR